MDNFIKGKTKSGHEWIPNFISTMDQEKCLGCGRCYKICGRGVLAPLQIEEDEEDDPRMIMEIANSENCIGCQACGKVCARKCYSFAPASLS